MRDRRQFLNLAAFCAAALLAGCGGGASPTKSIVVSHAAADLPAQTAHLEYLVLDDSGEWVAHWGEFGLKGGDALEVPEDTQVLLVRAHSGSHEVLDALVYHVSAANEATKPASYSRWMSGSDKVQASTLYQITIPGAHDAGMGKVNTCSSYASAESTQTQDTSVAGMLNNGIRYFDLRPIVVARDSEMRLGHYSWVGKTVNLGFHKFTLRNEGCTGYTVATALEDVRAFMAGSGNREVVILKMSHFQNLQTHDDSSSHFDPVDFAHLHRMIRDKLGPYLLIGNREFRYTPISTLTATGPKVIVTLDAKGHDGSDGIYSEGDLNLYDQYANESSYSAMKDDQFHKLASHARSMDEKPAFAMCEGLVGPISVECRAWAEAFHERMIRLQPYFVLSWTLTQSEGQMIACTVAVTDVLRRIAAALGYACKTLPELGKEADRHLEDVIAEAKKKRRHPHVLYVDDADTKATGAAIAINAMH